MKSFFTLTGCFSTFIIHAQVFCVQCFPQRTPLSTNVQNLITNGSFENNNCNSLGNSFCPASASYSCDISGWTCTGGGIATYATIFNTTNSAVADGNNAVYLGNFFCSACVNTSDDTTCLVDSGCVVTGIPPGFPTNTSIYGGDTGVSIEQTVNGLVPGECYVLDFWSGGEDGFLRRGVFAVDVGYGKIFLRCEVTEPSSNDPGLRYIVMFTANSTSQTIRFTNWGHINAYCTEVILDDVQLYSYSELSQTIQGCDGGCEISCGNIQITVPNVFTPNGDGRNDNLVVNSRCDFTFKIYNRWGQPLFENTGASVSWDGKYKNTDVPEGVYYYVVEKDGKSSCGFVELIR